MRGRTRLAGPEPVRCTDIDRPVSAEEAAALGVPGQIWNAYDANDSELSSGPGAADDARGLAAAPGDAVPCGDGAAPAARPAGDGDRVPGLCPAEAEARAGAPEAASEPGASPALRPDQPCAASASPAAAVTPSNTRPFGPTGSPPMRIQAHDLTGETD